MPIPTIKNTARGCWDVHEPRIPLSDLCRSPWKHTFLITYDRPAICEQHKLCTLHGTSWGETGTRLAADISEDLAAFFASSDSQAPWAAATIFGSRIRRNIRLAEAAGFGKSIFDYDPNCNGAADYGRLVDEVIAGESAGGLARAA